MLDHSAQEDWGYWDALAALEWQVELGADEATLDAAVDRFDLPSPVAIAKPTPPPGPRPVAAHDARPQTPARAVAADVDAVTIARQMAARATSLEALRSTMAEFEHCGLKRGARNLVFSDGAPSARVMVVGEAPVREEDRVGKPFAGQAGQLLDKMFAAIGLDRAVEGAGGLYVVNMLPWRPPQNREPHPDELAMMAPFVQRHIELAEPEVLVLMGNHACEGLLGRRGITRLRGTWEDVAGRPALPMFSPAYLLRNSAAKREAWADLLAIKERLG